MPSYRLPRGTADILPEDQARWAYVEEVAKRLAHRYGYQRIVTLNACTAQLGVALLSGVAPIA